MRIIGVGDGMLALPKLEWVSFYNTLKLHKKNCGHFQQPY